MRIHILGVCGTFMAGIAVLAKQMGHHVIGSDQAFYPPMSTQLHAHDIAFYEGYDYKVLVDTKPDLVIVGNTVKRGNPAIEWILNHKMPYISGPEWLREQVLSKQTVLAVAGTHGKTTTASILAWILEKAGLNPGFLIGGVPQSFGISARQGGGKYFVIEADEYDTAFFDKRSKMVHYRPDIAILNNLEYDHADIFPDLKAIQWQFHQMIRTMPEKGVIIRPQQSASIDETLALGCWSRVMTVALRAVSLWETGTPLSPSETVIHGLDAARHPGRDVLQGRTACLSPPDFSNWSAECVKSDGTHFIVRCQGDILEEAEVHWSLLGEHNVINALGAIAAARAVNVPLETACQALGDFSNVKRRLEVRGQVNGITVYDDFAHHPTAIAATISALRSHVGKARIIAVLHLASNSMKMGAYRQDLADSLEAADKVFVLKPDNAAALDWIKGAAIEVKADIDELARAVANVFQPNDHVLVMSNGNLGSLHEKLLDLAKN